MTGIHGGPGGAGGENHVIHQNHGLALDGKGDVGVRDHGGVGQGGQVVPVEGDIQLSHRDLHSLNAQNVLGQALGQGNAPGFDSDKAQVLGPLVLFHNLMGQMRTSVRSTAASSMICALKFTDTHPFPLPGLLIGHRAAKRRIPQRRKACLLPGPG